MVKDANDQLMNMVELCALDECMEKDPLLNKFNGDIWQLSVILIKQVGRSCKGGERLIFYRGDTHR